MTREIMKPIVNLNGTSARELVESRLDAADALQAALEALRRIAPHGRDYPNGAAAQDADWIIYTDRRASVARIIDDLTAEAFAIDQQERN
jgi:hypothetical protein